LGYIDIYQQFLKHLLSAGEGATVVEFIEGWESVGKSFK
jgi:hypothetical protein